MSQSLVPRRRRTVAEGAVHLPAWLDIGSQRQLVSACREWAVGPVPMRAAKLPGGHQMSVQTVCLGWHWQPYRYSRTADDVGGGRVAELPDWLVELGRQAVRDAYQDSSLSAGYRPDTALINYYGQQARMGMHQDKDEKVSDPVVSLSIGDSCIFRFGNVENRNKPWTDLELVSA